MGLTVGGIQTQRLADGLDSLIRHLLKDVGPGNGIEGQAIFGMLAQYAPHNLNSKIIAAHANGILSALQFVAHLTQFFGSSIYRHRYVHPFFFKKSRISSYCPATLLKVA